MPEDDAAGVFDVISEEVDHSLPEPVVETKTETEAPAKTAETQPEAEASPDSPTASPAAATDPEPLKTETKTDAEVVDWKASISPPPVQAALTAPEVDEAGNITNMNFEQYQNYLVTKAKQEVQNDLYKAYVENVALEAAEAILPEIKTNPLVRQLVENQRIAQVATGQAGDVVGAAQTIKQLLGDAMVQGSNNAKSSIEIQKNSALETGASQTKSQPSKGEQIAKRINQGDEDAFIDLLDAWTEQGYV